MLAKLLSVVGSEKLRPEQVVGLPELDQMLDVPTDRFATTIDRVARRFASARATLDLDGYRVSRLATGHAAGIPDLPDVRDTHYQTDLRRILPMDRPEEFRMARRHEFLRALVCRGLVRYGVAEGVAVELATQPAHQTLATLDTLPDVKDLDRRWFATMVRQFEALRNLYVEGALYIVLTTVNRYRGLGVDTSDLIQEGNASLFQAIDGFDWRRDVRFRTYAQFWVHQAVLKMLYNSSRTVRVPIWVQKILGKIRRAQDEGRRAGREPTHAEIAAKIGVDEAKVAWVLGTRRYAVSIDAEIGGEEGMSLAHTLHDENQVPVPESIPPGDLHQALVDAMADLPVREQSILQRRFGLGGIEPQTLGEIGADLGITAERVRQLQNAALGRMKRPNKLRDLQAFVE